MSLYDDIIDHDPLNIPTVTVKGEMSLEEWMDHGYTKFTDQSAFERYVRSKFKLPGKYKYNQYTQAVKTPADTFENTGLYIAAPDGSYDNIYYYEKEKEKCMKGVILKSKNGEWFFTGEHYMSMNYLPIFNKEKKTTGFPDLRDVQNYMSLYRLLAELNNKHSVGVKKRQILSSYLLSAFFISKLWFVKGIRLKLFTYYEKPYLQTTWQYLEDYRNFLNSETAWIRHMNPDKYLNWKQRMKIKQDGVDRYIGLGGELIGKPLYENPVGGVGGPTSYAWYEEPGIAPTLDTTFEYMRPALKEGELITGQFIAWGTVGELEQCKPLKKYIYNPDAGDFLAVDNPYYDDSGVVKKTGMFIPQQYGMIPYIDEYGNSKPDEAYDYLKEKRKELKQKLSAEDYQIRVSQDPLTLEETFAYRKESRFPMVLIKKHINNLETEPPSRGIVDLVVEGNEVKPKQSNKIPIEQVPVNPNMENKEGAIVVYEYPKPELPLGSYYAGIDPVSAGKTTTSNSLASIYVMRDSIELTTLKESGDHENIIMPSQVVCHWTGRFDNVDETNKLMMTIAMWYRARCVVENNISTFIQYAIHNKMQHMLMRKDELMFLKELNSNASVYQDYGWRNTNKVFDNMLDYFIKYIEEEIGEEEIPGLPGKFKKRYGIERIKDPAVLKEVELYENGENTDRLVALTSVIAYMSVLNNNRGFVKAVKQEDNNKKNNSIFAGQHSVRSIRKGMHKYKTLFKNIR